MVRYPMNNDKGTGQASKEQALVWLRDVLLNVIQIAPLSPRMKKGTLRLIDRVPDWLLDRWAGSLGIDYLSAYKAAPELASKSQTKTLKDAAQRYLESQDAVPVINILQGLVKRLVKLHKSGRLVVDEETTEKQVCALALAGCVPGGREFAEQAGYIISDREGNNHLLIDYRLALEYGNRKGLEHLDTTLSRSRYGEWIADRVQEVKRWLGLEPPRFSIRSVQRTPQWDRLWQSIFTGGRDE